MWDNAPLLRQIANLLFGIGVVLLLYGVVRYVLSLPVFPLRAVVLTAVPQRVPVDAIEKVVHEQMSGNFFTVDLDRTRQAFEQLPWVRKVSVRRKFPWMLEVELEEQQALATWNGTDLVNTHGEVFAAACDKLERKVALCGGEEPALPVFVGQPDSSQQVAQMYASLNNLLEPLKQRIAEISLSPRYAWQVRLDSGLVLELGREQMEQRMTRFVRAYPLSVAMLAKTTTHVDLRYRNGFAAYLPVGRG